MPSLNSAKPEQMLTASVGLNAQVCMLPPNPAELADFLYMLINHLQRRTLTPSAVCTGSQPWGGSRCGEVHSAGGVYGPVGGPKASIPFPVVHALSS